MKRITDTSSKKIKKIKVGLNLGCGPLPIAYDKKRNIHWLNIDNDRQQRYEEIARDKNCDFIWFDLRNDIDVDMIKNFYNTKFPTTDNKINIVMINMSEFFEHLNLTYGSAILFRCYNILSDGGIIRISVPDFKKLLDYYNNNKLDEFNNVQPPVYTTIKDPVTRLALITLGTLHLTGESGHKMFYSYEGLVELLMMAGFKEENISRGQHDDRYEASVALNHEVIITAKK